MQAPLSGSSLIGVGAPAQERNFSLFLSPPSFSQPEVTNNVVPIPDFVCTNSQHRSFSGRIYVDLTSRIDICPLVEYEFDQDNDVMVYLAEQTWTELANHFATPPPAPALSIEGLRFTDRQLADFCQAFAENVTFKVDADFPYVSVMVNGQGTHASAGQSSFRTISTSRSSMVQRYVFFSRD